MAAPRGGAIGARASGALAAAYGGMRDSLEAWVSDDDGGSGSDEQSAEPAAPAAPPSPAAASAPREHGERDGAVGGRCVAIASERALVFGAAMVVSR